MGKILDWLSEKLGGSAKTAPKNRRPSGGSPQRPKPAGSLGARAARPNSDDPNSGAETMEMFERLQDRMRPHSPIEKLREQHERPVAALAPRTHRITDTTVQTPPVSSSPGERTAPPQTASSTSSLPPTEYRNRPRAIASSPLANSASSHQPTIQPSTVLPKGRSGDVGGLVPGSNGPVRHPDAAVKALKEPSTLASIKSREERIAPTNHVCLDESLQQLNQAHDKLIEDYREQVYRKRRPETEDEYRKVVQRAIKLADPPQLGCYRQRARAKVRAAVVVVAIGKIRESLEMCLVSHDAITQDARMATLADGHRWVSRIRALEAVIEKNGEADNHMMRNPARRKLRTLPEGWELQLFEAAQAHPKWFSGVCVSLAIGVRPVELERGVLVRREGPNIEFTVKTAKASELHEGIGKRSLLLEPETPWVLALADKLGTQTEMVVEWPSAKKSFDAIAAIARSAMPDAKETVAGYVLRHRFACLLKEARFPSIEIARALGHSSTKQLSSYGTWNGVKRGGGLPLRITSDREPRAIVKPRGYISRRSKSPRDKVSG